MPEIEHLTDPEFSSQMQGLAEQAAQALEDRAAATRKADEEKRSQRDIEEKVIKAYVSLPQMLRPIVLGLEAVTRATADNTTTLGKIEHAAQETAEAQKSLPQLILDLRAMMDQRNSVSQRMFDALHEELKGYKDGFLLESVHRPIIRDLISLFDDICAIHQQMDASLKAAVDGDSAAAGAVIAQQVRTTTVRLEHNLDFILEVLNRLEVTQLPMSSGKLDKRTQRAVAVEIAETPEEDLHIARSLKHGFLWKDRVVRAEEVVVKKWKEGFLVAIPTEEEK